MSDTCFVNRRRTRFPEACPACCTRIWHEWLWCGWTSGRSFTSNSTRVSACAADAATAISAVLETVFVVFAEAEKVRDEQQIRTRLELRDRLKCKGFKWYLDNVWPEHFMPTDKRFFGKVNTFKHCNCSVLHGIVFFLSSRGAMKTRFRLLTVSCSFDRIYTYKLLNYTISHRSIVIFKQLRF